MQSLKESMRSQEEEDNDCLARALLLTNHLISQQPPCQILKPNKTYILILKFLQNIPTTMMMNFLPPNKMYTSFAPLYPKQACSRQVH